MTEFFSPVDSPDGAVSARVTALLRTTVRGRALGRLGELGAWVAACQGSDAPSPFRRPHALVVAGNHGIAARGVSAHSPESVAAQAEEISSGAGPSNVAARAANCSITLVDDWLARPCGSIDVEDAMTPEAFAAALARGRDLADNAVDSGADLILPGEIGVGSTTVSAALYGVFTRTEPVLAVGRGSGINDEVWKIKTAAVRDAMFRVRRFRHDVAGVLTAISSPDFVGLVGLIAQSAVRRTPLLLDGPYVTMAAYVAERLAPGTREWLVAAQLSGEPSHRACHKALGLNPILSLDVATGQAAGALLALPVVNAAAEMVGEEVTTLGA